MILALIKMYSSDKGKLLKQKNYESTVLVGFCVLRAIINPLPDRAILLV